MVTLEVRTSTHLDTVEEARIVGQAVERFLNAEGKNHVRVYVSRQREGKLPIREEVPLHLPERSTNTTQGRQEVEFRLMALGKNLRASIPVIPEGPALNDGVMVLDGKRWTINYQQLFDNVAQYAEKSEVKDAFNAAVALTLQQEATRGIK